MRPAWALDRTQPQASTRDLFIDLLLKQAGWPLDQTRDRELEVSSMPNAQGKGFVDYALTAVRATAGPAEGVA